MTVEAPRPEVRRQPRVKETSARVDRLMLQLPEKRDRQFDPVWKDFFTLTGIPRKSGQEQLVGQHLETTGIDRGYAVERDEAGNILWRIPASSPEYVTKEASFVAQVHQDMVCDGDPNPAVDGVNPEVVQRNGSWFVQSEGNKTTLGSDNGIMVAVAMQLPQLLEKAGIPHGEMAILFTVDEEQGLNGARALQFDLSKYGSYLNLDSEEDHEITIGSASVGDTFLNLPVSRVPQPEGVKDYTISLTGLMGGHSGVKIGEDNRRNAIKLVTQTLTNLQQQGVDFNLVSIQSNGNMNAIPNVASFTIATSEANRAALEKAVRQLQEEVGPTEKPGAQFMLTEQTQSNGTMLDTSSTQNVLALLTELPHGVQSREEYDATLVKTSTNLARTNLAPDNTIVELGLMSRSSSNNELRQLREDYIAGVAQQHGASVRQVEASPAWEPVKDSSLALLISQTHEALFGSPMRQVTTHGGLETSHVIHLYPHFQGHIASIGANVNNAHEVLENTEGPSVERTTRLVLHVIGRLAEAGKSDSTASSRRAA